MRPRKKKPKQDRSALLRDLKGSQRLHVKEWTNDEAAFDSSGHYEWMATMLGDARRVLEIGTGNGSSTLALCRGQRFVTAIEENPQFLKEAADKLRRERIETVVSQRRQYAEVTDEAASMFYTGNLRQSVPSVGAYLIGGNILDETDGSLWQWLTSTDRFDAIVCWNIGTHALLRMTTGSPANYREAVEAQSYVLANRLLLSGGVIHHVLRGSFVDDRDSQFDSYRDDLIDHHRELAKGTSLQVDPESVATRPYVMGPSNLRMVRCGTGERITENTMAAFWSIASRRGNT